MSLENLGSTSANPESASPLLQQFESLARPEERQEFLDAIYSPERRDEKIEAALPDQSGGRFVLYRYEVRKPALAKLLNRESVTVLDYIRELEASGYHVADYLLSISKGFAWEQEEQAMQQQNTEMAAAFAADNERLSATDPSDRTTVFSYLYKYLPDSVAQLKNLESFLANISFDPEDRQTVSMSALLPMLHQALPPEQEMIEHSSASNQRYSRYLSASAGGAVLGINYLDSYSDVIFEMTPHQGQYNLHLGHAGYATYQHQAEKEVLLPLIDPQFIVGAYASSETYCQRVLSDPRIGIGRYVTEERNIDPHERWTFNLEMLTEDWKWNHNTTLYLPKTDE